VEQSFFGSLVAAAGSAVDVGELVDERRQDRPAADAESAGPMEISFGKGMLLAPNSVAAGSKLIQMLLSFSKSESLRPLGSEVK
jgi:hypothetical protein